MNVFELSRPGPPKPQVELGMQQDHLEMSDSVESFDMPNRKATTTSAIEWRFVAAPLEGAEQITQAVRKTYV